MSQIDCDERVQFWQTHGKALEQQRSVALIEDLHNQLSHSCFFNRCVHLERALASLNDAE